MMPVYVWVGGWVGWWVGVYICVHTSINYIYIYIYLWTHTQARKCTQARTKCAYACLKQREWGGEGGEGYSTHEPQLRLAPYKGTLDWQKCSSVTRQYASVICVSVVLHAAHFRITPVCVFAVSSVWVCPDRTGANCNASGPSLAAYASASTRAHAHAACRAAPRRGAAGARRAAHAAPAPMHRVLRQYGASGGTQETWVDWRTRRGQHHV